MEDVNRRFGRVDAGTGSLVREHSVAFGGDIDCLMRTDETRKKFSAPMFPDGFAEAPMRPLNVLADQAAEI
ncbi:hypothetical protein [Bradyrhizobium sp. CCBAU 25338]|uniref:hypothetical protein n=1 Tax=Bradyrhizobium sp. CCBAU 25338 TaxID=1641877 RepID=UPI00230314D3|nr:hypothetical protein [Bradyrhizobium sp. CCBAU 25338]